MFGKIYIGPFLEKKKNPNCVTVDDSIDLKHEHYSDNGYK